jgi:hypothetical protein
LRRITPRSLDARRYAHSRTRLLHVVHAEPVLRAGTECTRPTVFAVRPLLTGDDAAIKPHLGHRAGVAPKPDVRSPARVAFGGTSYARTTLAVVPHLSAIGSRRAISDFACPPFAETLAPRQLPPAFADDFLGRGRLLPLSGFGHYHHTLFKGSDGGRSSRLAAELAWSVPCISCGLGYSVARTPYCRRVTQGRSKP